MGDVNVAGQAPAFSFSEANLPILRWSLRAAVVLLVALLALASLQCSRAEAQTVTLSAFDTQFTEFDLAIQGAGPVTLALDGTAEFDWCKPDGEFGTTVTPTTPALGVNNGDGTRAKSVTFTAPVARTRCDADSATSNGPPFTGGTVTVAGVQKSLVLAGGVWSATFSSSTPDPPPPPAVTGSSTLTWQAPTQNVDETPLTDLAGFVAYWSMTQGTYPNSFRIENPAARSYEVTGLAPGLWYFVVTAFNTANIESEHSEVASAVVEADEPPVDCVVNDPPWVLGIPQPTTCPASGMQTRTDTRTLSIVTPPANGGAECPSLNETRSVPVTCVPPPTDPCVLRPFTFTVRTWPGGVTGSRSLAYTTNKRLSGLPTWGYNAANTRVISVTATDFEGCTRTVTRP